MDIFRIYLSGGMQKFGKEDFEKSDKWRRDVVNIFDEYNHWSDVAIQVHCFNPNDLYSFNDDNIEDSQLTIMENDLWHLKHSDLVLVNFNDVYSLGTMAELAIAYDRNIPIIGIKEDTVENLHSWHENFCKRIFLDTQSACEYVYNTYVGLL